MFKYASRKLIFPENQISNFWEKQKYSSQFPESDATFYYATTDNAQCDVASSKKKQSIK